jgi:anti-sigma factor RsiW
MNSECEHLDAYFAGDLPADGLLRFEHHLLVCDSCRDAVRQQHWIDELLSSPLRVQFEPTPEFNLASLSHRTASQRARRLQLAAGAIAASLLVAAGLVAFTASHKNATATSAAVPVKETHDVARSTFNPRPATFVSDENAIAVSLQSDSSDVTVVQVFPTLETERRWHRELVLQNTLSKSNGG